MKRNMKYIATLALCCAAAVSNAALTEWTGAVDGDWSNSGNWTAGTPAMYTTGISGSGNGVTIDGSLPQQPTSNVPAGFDALQTPNMTISGGYVMTLQGVRGNGGTGRRNGEIANVSGAGTHLNLTSADGSNWQLNREGNGTEVWNVSNGGKVTLNGTGRIDMSFNDARLTEINLDGGIFEVKANQIFGTRGNAANFTSTAKNFVSLDNGSLMDYAGYFEAGNLYVGAAYTTESTINFNFLDTASAVRLRAGTSAGIFGNAANIDQAFGTMFTTSVPGGTLQKTDLGGGIYEITVIPEPATLGLVAVFGGGILFIRRRFMI